MLLLQAMEEASVSKGGIIIPEAHRRTMNQGIILEMGPEVPQIVTVPGATYTPKEPFSIGEIVIFPLHSEFRIDLDDTVYYLVRASEIIAGDNGEQARSEGGVEDMKFNKFKKREASSTPPLQVKEERRKPLSICKWHECQSKATVAGYCEEHHKTLCEP